MARGGVPVLVRDGQLLRVTIIGRTSMSADIDPANFEKVQALLDDLQAAEEFSLVSVVVSPEGSLE